jgi:hypothetical protein
VTKPDCSEPFELQFKVHIRDAQFFLGTPYFGLEIKSSEGTRVGGFGTHPEALIPADLLSGIRVFVVTFPFKSIKALCANKFRLAFAVHDDEMTRTVYIHELDQIETANTKLGPNHNSDILDLGEFGKAPSFSLQRPAHLQLEAAIQKWDSKSLEKHR